jgi:RNA polymerase sigma-70 factor (ECF subfamily)
MVQGFFASLLEKNYFKDSVTAKGRFRTFLLTALKRYMANEWNRANRQKRGGGLEMASFDAEETEIRYLAEPDDSMSPEKAYDRQWAISLLATVLDRLEQEYATSGKQRIFRELRVFLTGEGSEVPYADVGRNLELSEGNVKIMVHRLRQRYGVLVRKEIAETVVSPEAVEAELRHLISVLS